MKIARISKGSFGKSQCNTEMSTVIPIDLKREMWLLVETTLGNHMYTIHREKEEEL